VGTASTPPLTPMPMSVGPVAFSTQKITVGSLRVVVVYFPDGVVALFLQVVIWVQAGACGAQDPERRARCE
jgi:hypothetical protein